jgi:iron complex outermembrane receptor protein
VNVPLLRGLELGASLRYDRYSDFGGTTNPKVAIRWQPVTSMLLRGTAGTGFRAPTLANLYTPPSGTYVSNVDPVRCPVTRAPDDCAGPFRFVQSGNLNLRPETSTQYSAGAVWEPVPGNSLGVQWWRIDVANAINNYQPFEIFHFYDNLAPDHIVRGPPDPAYPGLPGPITALLAPYENVGNPSTSGLDVTLNARYVDPSAGTFRFSLNGTYILSWFFTSPDGEKVELAGTGAFGATPRWRHYAELAWQRGPWAASIAQLFQSSYADWSISLPPRDVGTYSLWNLQGVYSGFRDWTLAAGIRNVFDTTPPFSNQPLTGQVGYDPSYADPRERTFYLRASYAFR